MPVKTVSIPDMGTIHLYKRRGSRALRLSVTDQGKIRVSLPHWVPYQSAVDFAHSRKDWIRSQLNEPVALAHGDRIGKAHRIVFLPDAARITVTTRIVGSEIRIHHPKELMESDHSVQAAAQNASVRALKTQAEKLLPQRIEKLAAHHGFRYRSIRIKRLKSRWGSCSSDGEIVLNAFLMQLHWHLIDYVLLHELMHTRIMAHGPTFWNELESYVPNLKAVRNEIKNHRPILLAQKQPLRA